MTCEFSYPDKPRRGDAVAVLSPSAGLPARFPRPYELGLTRLREEFGLQPVEYPTTRTAQASPAARAADIHAAFADPDIKAVIASIGGEDELKVLAHLDPDVLRANPKPFFGYSDNTNLLNWLWFHGVAGYHGGSTMVHLGRPGGLHDLLGPLQAEQQPAGQALLGDRDHPVGQFGQDGERDVSRPADRDAVGHGRFGLDRYGVPGS